MTPSAPRLRPIPLPRAAGLPDPDGGAVPAASAAQSA
jgi:hypothetical protein